MSLKCSQKYKIHYKSLSKKCKVLFLSGMLKTLKCFGFIKYVTHHHRHKYYSNDSYFAMNKDSWEYSYAPMYLLVLTLSL